MRKRIIPLALALILLVSVVPGVQASEHGMTDISGHWAEDDIAWVLEMGLFNGVSATEFNPGGTMTRGMFVTVLGRYAGIDPDDYEDWYLPELYTDVDDSLYYAPYINWATRHGITSGTGGRTFSPDAPITREQMAVFLVRFAQSYGYLFTPGGTPAADSFADQDKISGYALESVEVMRYSGLLTGRLNSQGTYNFDPQALAVRCECAAVFHRLFYSLAIDEEVEFSEPEDISLHDYDLRISLGDRYTLTYELEPVAPNIATVTWVSSDPEVVSVASDGTITALANGEAEIYAYTCNGLFDYCNVYVEGYIGYAGESYESKCMHIFGEVVENHRRPYGDDAPKSAYEENYVTVTVKVWDFADGIGSEKVTKTRSFYVHKNLELTVRRLFEEIYACEEQYPIKSIVTYWASGGNSEHNPGTAIDINPEENPYVDPNGNVLVGEKFDPENNPYSIPIDGEVQQIFEKYGFTRGIYWRSGYKDYMHFSFFGT